MAAPRHSHSSSSSSLARGSSRAATTYPHTGSYRPSPELGIRDFDRRQYVPSPTAGLQPQPTHPPRADELPRLVPGTLVAFGFSAKSIATIGGAAVVNEVERHRFLGLVYAAAGSERDYEGEDVMIAFVAGFPPAARERARSMEGMAPLAEHCVAVGALAPPAPGTTRAPLRIAAPAHAFAWTTVGVRARVNRVWPTTTPSIISAEDLIRFKTYLYEDLSAQRAAPPVASTSTTPTRTFPHATPFLGGVTQLRRAHQVNIWLDITEPVEWADPATFYAIENEMNRLLPRGPDDDIFSA